MSITLRECVEGTITKFILLHPSIQLGSHTVVSIPAVIPMLNLPINWILFHSLGTEQLINISGCFFKLLPTNNLDIIASFVAPGCNAVSGQSPHLVGATMISYLSVSIRDVIKSLV